MFRDPVLRYISEWKHVQRGATWSDAKMTCREDIPACYQNSSWKDVSLKEFMQCPYNLATNRQTHMIASLGDFGCANLTHLTPEARDTVILESAKANLMKMSFYGFTEHQLLTKEMFELVFNTVFKVPWKQTKSSIAIESSIQETSQETRLEIARLNTLDIKLYQFAKDLFHQRLKKLQDDDMMKKSHTI